MDSLGLIFYITVFVLIALWVFVLVTQERDREQTFQKAAQRQGWRYLPSANELIETYGVLPLFGRGRERLTSNVIQGGSGNRPNAVFDFQYTLGYTLGSESDDAALRQTVAVFHLPDAHLPHFTLEPCGTTHPIEGLFGYGEIDFMQVPGFSKVYRMRGQDVVQVQECFRPDVLARFQQEPGWHVEGAGDQLVVYRAGIRIEPQDLPAFIDGTSRIAAILRKA
jgi:hypothetical protein